MTRHSKIIFFCLPIASMFYVSLMFFLDQRTLTQDGGFHFVHLFMRQSIVLDQEGNRSLRAFFQLFTLLTAKLPFFNPYKAMFYAYHSAFSLFPLIFLTTILYWLRKHFFLLVIFNIVFFSFLLKGYNHPGVLNSETLLIFTALIILVMTQKRTRSYYIWLILLATGFVTGYEGFLLSYPHLFLAHFYYYKYVAPSGRRREKKSHLIVIVAVVLAKITADYWSTVVHVRSHHLSSFFSSLTETLLQNIYSFGFLTSSVLVVSFAGFYLIKNKKWLYAAIILISLFSLGVAFSYPPEQLTHDTFYLRMPFYLSTLYALLFLMLPPRNINPFTSTLLVVLIAVPTLFHQVSLARSWNHGMRNIKSHIKPEQCSQIPEEPYFRNIMESGIEAHQIAQVSQALSFQSGYPNSVVVFEPRGLESIENLRLCENYSQQMGLSLSRVNYDSGIKSVEKFHPVAPLLGSGVVFQKNIPLNANEQCHIPTLILDTALHKSDQLVLTPGRYRLSFELGGLSKKPEVVLVQVAEQRKDFVFSRQFKSHHFDIEIDEEKAYSVFFRAGFEHLRTALDYESLQFVTIKCLKVTQID